MRAALLLVLGLALLAGCGDDDDDGPDGSGPPASEGAADADAKSRARQLATELEACFADQQDYRRCRGADTVKDAEVSEAGATTYTVLARSESGTVFEIEKQKSGAMARICSPGGEGGCPDGGHW